MSSEEYWSILKEQHVSVLKQEDIQLWNRWRFQHHGKIYLEAASLNGLHFKRADLQANEPNEELGEDGFGRLNLSSANLRGANLQNTSMPVAVLMRTDLSHANLTGANVSHSFLNGANLSNADLSQTDLSNAEVYEANLEEAIFFRTNLNNTRFVDANLTGAKFVECSAPEVNFTRANLTQASFIDCNIGAHFYGTNLKDANFIRCNLSNSVFANTLLSGLDLSTVQGLENTTHHGPSIIGMDTIARSKGVIPKSFLRGCGLSDWEIEQVKLYNPTLENSEINEILYSVYALRASRALQISNLFISYSHQDSQFVDKVEARLNEMGVRNWRDIHDMKAGPMEKQLDRAIRQNPTVLLVLSESSLGSDWVQHEVRVARELGKELGRDVLCPVALDSSWQHSSWPERIMEQIMEYHIVNFAEWNDDEKFDKTFRKMVDGLELFYKG